MKDYLDPFWASVPAQEKAAREALQAAIDKVDRELNLRKRTQALEHAPGFTDFIKAVGDLREATFRRMMKVSTSEPGAERDMWELRGYVKAIADIQSTFETNSQRMQALEQQRKSLENRLADSNPRAKEATR